MLTQPIAGSLDLHDGIVQETITKRGCDDGIAKHVGPFGTPRLEVRIIGPFLYRALINRKNRLVPPLVFERYPILLTISSAARA
ncbi:MULTISPECIES: hypothetical protein [Komagataeibacter]|uniref:hypothetical protein n=1 Tax=Komagataeibacter TaxID=1434011 RepID=UPI0030B8418C